MPWPTDDLSTAGVDSGADRPPRAEFFKLFQRVKTMIAARGAIDGVARLDGRRRVPDAELGRGVANGVAALDGAGIVPAAQLPPPPAIPDAVPVGTVAMWAGPNTPPTGWHSCFGGTVSRTTYAELFAVIGTTYGPGNGSTTFTLPNFSTRVPVGRGGGRVRGDTGGAATHRLSADEMPEHRHFAVSSERFSNQQGDSADRAFTWASNGGLGNSDYAGGGSTDEADAGLTSFAGDGQAHNNMPPFLVVNFIIKW